MKIALIQIATIEENPEANLNKIAEFAKKAKEQGAQMAVFHEGTLTDYVRDVNAFAQEIPSGPACQFVIKLAEELNLGISFGLIERDGIRCFITQVFISPNGFEYRYRKTWLYPTEDRIKRERRHRNEPSFFNPGSGPELFDFMGIKNASCIICADAMAEKCFRDLNELKPSIIFYPNNREIARAADYWSSIAKKANVPLLVTNRVGVSWGERCEGGCFVISKNGEVLATTKTQDEEILVFDLKELGM